MDVFDSLFGVSASSIKKTCVLSPVINRDILKGFGLEKLCKGNLYGTGDNGLFSFIHTGIGASFAGDCVLYLKDTPCENLVLFGSCGAARDDGALSLGSIVLLEQALSQDSFVSMLHKKEPAGVFFPDAELFKKLLYLKEEFGFKTAKGLTVASLKMEEEYVRKIGNGADVLDMEASAFFAACRFSGKKGAALFYVSDMLGKVPWYSALDRNRSDAFRTASREASFKIYLIIKKAFI